MEIRARIGLSGLPLDDDAVWEPFIETLEQDAEQYGPVLSWENRGARAVVTMSADTRTVRVGVSTFLERIDSALAAHRIDAYPVSIAVEPGDDHAAAA